jgi:GntP family gluconate:H+ symporter
MNMTLTAIAVILSIILIIFLTSKFRLNAFFSLIIVSIILALVTLSTDEVIMTIKTGFGNTLASIGLIILFGTAIGVLLDKTGATFSMAKYIMRLTGKDKAPRAISITGFIAGLPIFCDSGFIVLSGLNKSLAKESGISRIRMAGSLAIALYTLHCLIPPHPGITAAAGIMNTPVGKLIILGIAVAVPTVLAGYLWVKIMSKKHSQNENVIDESHVIPEKLPGTFLSFMPVIVPLVLITLNSFLRLLSFEFPGTFIKIMNFMGDPVAALLIGVILAMALIRKGDFHQVNDIFNTSIDKAGPILAITAAGGAFGAVIKATGMGDQATQVLASSHLGILVPFLLAAIFKTAQGSSTVAAITTASLIAPMMTGLGINNEMGQIFALLAIGSGSMMVSHANDSYFWVITKFSGISPKASLSVYSTGTIVISVVSFLIIWALSFIML